MDTASMSESPRKPLFTLGRANLREEFLNMTPGLTLTFVTRRNLGHQLCRNKVKEYLECRSAARYFIDLVGKPYHSTRLMKNNFGIFLRVGEASNSLVELGTGIQRTEHLSVELRKINLGNVDWRFRNHENRIPLPLR